MSMIRDLSGYGSINFGKLYIVGEKVFQFNMSKECNLNFNFRSVIFHVSSVRTNRYDMMVVKERYLATCYFDGRIEENNFNLKFRMIE